jgi:OmpA-OmpF porin, OOP family
MLVRLALLLVLIPAVAAALSAKPPEFIKPYPGQKPYGGEPIIVREFAEVHLLTAKNKSSDKPGPEWKRVEGKVTTYHFDMPEGRSVLEVSRNYEQALTSAGFEKVFVCGSQDECGETMSVVPTWEGAVNNFISSGSRYVLAKLQRPDTTVWAAVYVTSIGNPLTKVIVAEEKAMETGLVKVDATALRSALEQFGHIAVYGIVFDTGKATLKPESSTALGEVKTLLEANPQLKLYVVGHTDDVGSESANVTLSSQRAAAVVKELTGRYKVAANRLKAQGAGPYVPVASNRNEQGRAKNRRVELVEDVP